MKRRIFRVILCILLLFVAADTGYIIYHRATEKPVTTPSPTPTLSGRDWLNAIIESGDDTPANAASKAATEELLRTGTVTYGGHTYTMPWYRVVKEWVWEVFPEMRRICSSIFGPSRK